MRKGFVLLFVVFIFGMVSPLLAQTGDIGESDLGGLGVDIDVTWVSKYIWRGVDLLDDKAAIQPSINLDLYGTGFSFTVWSSFAGSSKGGGSVSTVDAEEWDYILTYANSVLEGEQLQTDYAFSWLYYDYPDVASKDADAQEFALALSWPELCPFGVVPSYTLVKMWCAQGGGLASGLEGFIHVFGLSYDLDVMELESPLSFTWDITYNDGAGVGGGVVAHDWSHTTFGVSTAFDVGPGTFTPGVYYQISMDDSVNTEDEFWTGLSYSFSF